MQAHTRPLLQTVHDVAHPHTVDTNLADLQREIEDHLLHLFERDLLPLGTDHGPVLQPCVSVDLVRLADTDHRLRSGMAVDSHRLVVPMVHSLNP
jgi:hypothetical protein